MRGWICPDCNRLFERERQSHDGRFWPVANLATPEDVDDDLCALLTEAYRGDAVSG